MWRAIKYKLARLEFYVSCVFGNQEHHHLSKYFRILSITRRKIQKRRTHGWQINMGGNPRLDRMFPFTHGKNARPHIYKDRLNMSRLIFKVILLMLHVCSIKAVLSMKLLYRYFTHQFFLPAIAYIWRMKQQTKSLGAGHKMNGIHRGKVLKICIRLKLKCLYESIHFNFCR